MNPRQFLIFGGAVLLLLGLIGYIGVFNEDSTPWFWLDSAENLAHVFLGLVALGVVLLPGVNRALAPFHRLIVIAVGAMALFFSVYGFLQAGAPEPNTFGISNLENPSDNILHLVVAIWAFAAAFGPEGRRHEERVQPMERTE